MPLARTIMNGVIWRLARILCRVDDAQLARVPKQGPLILVTNHVNFLDAPLLYTHLQPRAVTAFAKVETWDNPLLGLMFTIGGAIPLRRGEADVGALRRGLAELRAGHIVAVAPEGTRSGDGRLRQGKPGVVTLALHSGAPLLPVAFYGGEAFKENLPRLRRTSFHIVVGRPFHLIRSASPKTPGSFRASAVRQQMADEIMYQLAALLPPEYRGYYADLGKATTRYLRWE